MKTLFVILIALAGVTISHAQGTASEEHLKEMKKLAYMEGKWSGEASMRQQNGTVLKVNQEENIQYKLDGTVLLVEGTGRSQDAGNAIVFNALAIVSYNPHTKTFSMKSHVLDGNQTDAYFKILSDNNFEWGFETPTKAKIKYTIVLDPQANTWNEKGSYSPDGSMWYPFLEMNLKKENK